MATSKRQQKAVAGDSSKTATTTLTARFSAAERDLIEKAAGLRKWSSAKLLRDAALEKARDIVNASGDNARSLDALAAELVTEIRHPKGDFTPDSPDDPHSRIVTLRVPTEFLNDLYMGPQEDAEYVEFDVGAPWPEFLIRNVQLALQTAPTEFARSLVAQFEQRGLAPRYQPEISALESEEEPEDEES